MAHKSKYATNLLMIWEKMKDKPKKHQLYSHFMGVPGSLTANQLKEFKKHADWYHKIFIKDLDKSIAQAEKIKC